MKNIKLLCLFLLLFQLESIKAQPNQFFPIENALWESATIGISGIPMPEYQVLCGDTTVQNIQYSKLYSLTLDSLGNETSRSYLGGTRMETDLVFFVEANSSTEYLLYDFSLETSQSISIQTIFGDTKTLTALSNELIDTPDGVTRRVIHFDSESWIEGIGSTRGLLTRALDNIADLNTYLNCFKSFNQLGYSNPNTQPECLFSFEELCETTSLTNPSFENLIDFSISPNPVNTEAHIKIFGFQHLLSPKIRIYNLQGQIIEKFGELNEEFFLFSRKRLKAGVYVFELSDGKTTFALRKKIIIQ